MHRGEARDPNTADPTNPASRWRSPGGHPLVAGAHLDAGAGTFRGAAHTFPLPGTRDGRVATHLAGFPGSNLVAGAGDTLLGDADDDTVHGGPGADIAGGSSGDDTINGDAGDDKLYGGPGDDTLIGDLHRDTIYGGGDDTNYGGTGWEVCSNETTTNGCERILML
jgi:Ca2+-binding RTX toxin-like protein